MSTRTNRQGNRWMSRIERLRRIVRERQMAKVDGVRVDTFTAHAIVNIYDQLNEENQRTFGSMDVRKMAAVTWKLVGKIQAGI